MVDSKLPRQAAAGKLRARQKAARKAPTSGAIDGRQAGELVHEIVGEMLAEGIREPSPEQVFGRVARHPATRRAAVYRQAARLRLATAVSLYCRFFMPDASWSFEGAEVAGRSCRFDLVWSLPDGRIVADEIKSGLVDGRRAWAELEDQVERLRKAGLAKFGARFVGVRVVLLSAPTFSYLARADGIRAELMEVDS